MWWWGACAGASCCSDVLAESRADVYEELIPILTDDRHTSSSFSDQARLVDRSVVAPGIYVARNKRTQQYVALKVFRKSILKKKESRRRLRHEIKVLSLLRDHPNILQLYGFYTSRSTMEIAFELARGGEVMDRVLLDSSDRSSFTEQEVSRVIGSVASALSFMHRKLIVHGEVRPEHVLYEDSEPEANVILADFGRAAHPSDFTFQNRRAKGTVMWTDLHDIKFLPPFVLRKKQALKLEWPHAAQLDVWALGVTMYILLTASYPFDGKSVDEVEYNALYEELRFPSEKSGIAVSRAAKDLLHRMLCKKPEDAISLDEVLDHPWIESSVASAVVWSDDVLRRRREFVENYGTEVSLSSMRRRTSQSSSFFNKQLSERSLRQKARDEASEETLEDRPSYVSAAGNELQTIEGEIPLSADGLMRQASVEFSRLVDNTSFLSSGTQPKKDPTTPAPTGTLWQALREQRRLLSMKSQSPRSNTVQQQQLKNA